MCTQNTIQMFNTLFSPLREPIKDFGLTLTITLQQSIFLSDAQIEPQWTFKEPSRTLQNISQRNNKVFVAP